ncbi:cytochrome P450 [Aspergillus crustosus]
MFSATSDQIVALAVALLAGWLICLVIYNSILHPLAGVPGPWTGKILPLWTMRAIYYRRLNPDLEGLHKLYGPVVRVGPKQLSFATIDAQKRIFHSTRGSHDSFTKEGTLQDMILATVLDAPNVGTLTDPVRHRQLRNRLLAGFTPKAVLEQESLIRLHVDRLLERIGGGQGVIDLTEHFVRFSWEMIGDLAFGEPLIPEQCDTLRTLLSLYEWCSPILEIINYALPQLRAVINHVVYWMPSVSLNAILPGATLRDCIDRQDGRSDFLTHIMHDNSNRKTELQLSYKEIQSNATILVLAGFKTTETSLSAVFYHLLSNPDSLHNLQQELRHTFKDAKEITCDNLLPLNHLNGCINETLRLTPPLSGKIASRTSPGTKIGDIYAPAGTEVFSETYTMQRSPRYWFAPDQFRPERWYEREAGSGSVYVHDNHAAFKPFGLGPRVCLGRDLALQILRLSVALLVYRFDFGRPVDGRFVWDDDVTSRMTYTNYRVLADVHEYGVHGSGPD